MALPTKDVAWTYSQNNRISYTSVVQVMRDTIYLIKQRLVAQGYVVKGSCDGTTGAMDGVDRWASATNAGVRAVNTTTPCSWIVLTDGNGANILFAYVAAGVSPTGDDIYRISVSHAGTYVAAATPSHTPTSTAEQLLNTFFTTNGTIVLSTASVDRLVNIWTAPGALGFRVWILRAGVSVCVFGVDSHTPLAYAPGVTVSAGHGFYVLSSLASAGYFMSDSIAGSGSTTQARMVVRTNQGAGLASCSRSAEMVTIDSGSSSAISDGQTFAPELQGTEYKLKRLKIWSNLAAARGDVGIHKDWWIGRTGVAAGDTYGNREFVCVVPIAGLVWPWDGTAGVPGAVVTIS